MAKDKEDKKKVKEMENGEESEAGFTVKDKRKIGKEDEETPKSDAEGTVKSADADAATKTDIKSDIESDIKLESETKDDKPPIDEAPANEASTNKDISDKEKAEEYPPINFMTFIMSLSTSALIYLGEIPDPVDNEKKKIVPLAKQMIDLISMLDEKTKGNLTTDEEKYMENIPFELRMVFIKATAK